ncbi:MAG: hypothetical protein GXN93_05540 [Candidatus Diapherotrites archaeon]|nr:hypothetical protein [Candidatus Diapherotrites archaeon]
MQDWVVIALIATGMYFLLFAIRLFFRVEERQKKMAEMQKRLKEDPEALTEEELAEMTKHMGVIMGISILSLILFLPIYYVIRARYGVIETPLGKMAWFWWYAIVAFGLSIIIGGVRKWLARS